MALCAAILICVILCQSYALAEPEEFTKTPYVLFAEAYLAGDDLDVGEVFDSFGGIEKGTAAFS